MGLTVFSIFDKLIKPWGCSEVGLSRWPVTPEIAGSSPVTLVSSSSDEFFFT